MNTFTKLQNIANTAKCFIFPYILILWHFKVQLLWRLWLFHTRNWIFRIPNAIQNSCRNHTISTTEIKDTIEKKSLVLIKDQKEQNGCIQIIFLISVFHFKHEHFNCENRKYVISERLKLRFWLCYHLRRNLSIILKAFRAFLKWEMRWNRISALKRRFPTGWR